MQYFLSAAALVASATFCSASPVEKRDTFQVKQVAHGEYLKSGPLQMMKTFQKYSDAGAVAPEKVVSAAAAVQSGTVSAQNQIYDQSYLCPVKVGANTLMLDFDTGSADLWAFSTRTPSSQSSGHTLYNPSSGTLKSGYTWKISYGDGSGAAGVVYSDKVQVGAVTATSQAVEAATSVSAQFTQDTNNDGLLGLAFSSINTVKPQQQTTFFDTVKPTLKQKLFTADLKAGQPGTYDFGYIDSSKYSGSITYVPVNTANGFWQFTAGGYGVGSGSVSGSIGSAIADTGTSLLYLPDAVINAYYNKVSGAYEDDSQGGVVFPCNANLPNLKISIGGSTYTVPGSYINYAPIDNSGTTCFGGLQSSDGIGFNILGDVFLKAVFVVFDQTQSSPRLGFAAQ